VCLLYNAETMSVEKARLDSHVFPAIAEAYESPFLQPWGPNTRLFVRASSPRLLSLMGSPIPPSNDDTFAAFSRSVRTHLHRVQLVSAPVTTASGGAATNEPLSAPVTTASGGTAVCLNRA
jgi:hypothetical protein